MASGGYAQEMPKEVTRFLDNYFKDSTVQWGPLYAKKKDRFNDSVKIKDLRMRVLEVYVHKHIFLNDYPDTVSFSEFIEPSGSWLVLIMAHNKPLYQLELINTTGGPEFVGMAYLESGTKFREMWELLLKYYPASTGINPVLFAPYGGMSSSRSFLYFKQLGSRKIYYRRSHYENDPLEELFPASIETLDDSKKLIEYWKKQGLNEIGKR